MAGQAGWRGVIKGNLGPRQMGADKRQLLSFKDCFRHVKRGQRAVAALSHGRKRRENHGSACDGDFWA